MRSIAEVDKVSLTGLHVLGKGSIAQKYAETVPFDKIPIPEKKF